MILGTAHRRNRDFLLLWTGQVVSTLGTRISGLAYPLIVLAVTGSAAQAGLVAAAQAAPFLIWFLPAGALVDRWSRKRMIGQPLGGFLRRRLGRLGPDG